MQGLLNSCLQEPILLLWRKRWIFNYYTYGSGYIQLCIKSRRLYEYHRSVYGACCRIVSMHLDECCRLQRHHVVSLVVLSGSHSTGTHTFTNASCSGAPDGTITVTPNTPGSYTYMLNPGGITNTTGVFTGLTPGTYSVLATSSVGCSFVRSNIVINAGSSLSGTATSATTTCPGATDGTIIVDSVTQAPEPILM